MSVATLTNASMASVLASTASQPCTKPSHVTRHTPHVTRHTSHVTRHTSHVTRHTSHVTRHCCFTRHSDRGGTAPVRKNASPCDLRGKTWPPREPASHASMPNCASHVARHTSHVTDPGGKGGSDVNAVRAQLQHICHEHWQFLQPFSNNAFKLADRATSDPCLQREE
jgi:hypothetical protein